MNEYNLGISGSWLLYILLVLIGFGIAYYSYSKTVPPISRGRKSLFLTLRTLAIALLLMVLFEPVLTGITSKTKEPVLAVLFDDSKSMKATDAKGNRKEIYKNVLNDIDLESLNNENKILIKFDDKIDYLDFFSFDSLSLEGDYTDMSYPFRKINEISEKKNIRSVLMITDGAFNEGNNPLYDAEKFGKPVYTLGIGDTNMPKDIKVTSILANDIVYLDNKVPVNVYFESNGLESDSVDLTLKENQKVIENKKIYIDQNKQRYSEFFEYTPKTKGDVKLTATIEPVQNELTVKNNSLSKFVEVRDNKRTITIFAGYPYPDISFITEVLEKNEGYEVKKYIQKLNADFYSEPDEDEIARSDLFILAGFPISSTPNNVLNMLKTQLGRGKPIFFISGLNTDYRKLRLLEEYLPFSTNSSQQREFEALGKFKSEYSSHPLLKSNGKIVDINYWNSLPPMFRTETFVTPKAESEILATVSVNNVDLNEPLILTRSFQRRRSVAFLGYGIYRWKLLGYASNQAYNDKDDVPDLFTAFINNTVKWLMVNDVDKLVDFKTTKNFYSGDEKIEITAQVYDAALNPIDDANVTMQLKDTASVREITLNPVGNGRYYVSLENLNAGEYSYTGKAVFEGKNLGSDLGRFTVGELNLEFRNLMMNAGLLNNISGRTGGKFYYPDEASQVIDDIKAHDNFKEFPVTVKNETDLWNLPLLLAIAIILFAIEWFLRKRTGLV